MSHNNFIISDINGRFNSLLREHDYNTLRQCKTLEDLTIKLNQHFPFINEDVGLKEFRQRFVENIKYELKEFDIDLKSDHAKGKETMDSKSMLIYFIEYYRIISFFNQLQNVPPNSLGLFPELKSIGLCKTFKDVEKLCINNCFLKEYFAEILTPGSIPIDIPLAEGNYQTTLIKIIKIHMDGFYRKAVGFFREILEIEGDRQILEICLNGRSLENKAQYFPEASTLSRSDLDKLGKTNEVDEIKKAFQAGDVEPRKYIGDKISKTYVESFKQLNDISCLYAYFKLREQEAENVLWIVECILQGYEEHINEISTFED